jgi:hypothetical protein
VIASDAPRGDASSASVLWYCPALESPLVVQLYATGAVRVFHQGVRRQGLEFSFALLNQSGTLIAS